MTGLLGWLGAVALLFALLNLILLLFTSIATGFGFRTDMVLLVLNFLAGIVLLGVALVSNLDALRERLATGGARRAGKYGTSSILNAALLVAVLALLAFLSTRYHRRFDWTESRTHSLTEQTRKVLDGLTEDVEVTALYSAVAAPQARELLDRYAYASPRFKVSFVDPQAHPGKVKELRADESKLGRGLVHVALGGESVQVDEPDEEKVTNALVKLTRRTKKKVYFVTGHNERPLDGEGAGEELGLKFAKEALQNENYQVETLLLASQAEVPADADALVAAGPTRPFHPDEHAVLGRYLARGGALLVLIDPRAQTDLYAQLSAWGVEVGDDVVVDRLQGLAGRPQWIFAGDYPTHAITEGLRDPTLFFMARSVQAKSEAGKAFSVLVRSGSQSWADRDLDQFFEEGRAELSATDLRGPVPLAVAGQLDLAAEADGAKPEGAEKAGAGSKQGAEAKPEEAAKEGAKPEAEDDGKKQARLVVIGDADFAANGLIQQFGNRDFFVNAVNWLLGDVEAISVRPNAARASRLQLTGEQFSALRSLSLFVLPEAIAVLGVVVWWRRRRTET
jgi:ABC-type uncharacterized transport system involved in gliding motility auxiliary subunit